MMTFVNVCLFVIMCGFLTRITSSQSNSTRNSSKTFSGNYRAEDVNSTDQVEEREEGRNENHVMVNSITTPLPWPNSSGNETNIMLRIDDNSTRAESIHTDREMNSTKLKMLAYFMNLQAEACQYVSLCTLRNKTSFFALKTRSEQRECCHYCSCETTCILENNCCPDYGLSQILGNVTFESVEVLIDNIELNDDIITETFDTVDSEERNDVECRRQQVLPNRAVYPAGPDYKVVTLCPDSYKDREIIRKCEYPQLDELDVFDYVPVYSQSHNKTYKNIFCLHCHGHSLTRVFWLPVIRCSTFMYDQRHFRSPKQLLYYFLNAKGSNCNLVFKPPENTYAQKCTLVNVASCSKRNKNKLLQDACRTYNLPVDKTYRGRDTYRNIACYYCNRNEAFAGKCYNFYQETTTYELYVDPTFFGLQSNSSDVGLVNTTDLTTSGKCEPGLAWDDRKNSCRQVFCPKNMFSSAGICRPLYEQIDSVSYVVKLLVVVPDNVRGEHSTRTLVQNIEDRVAELLKFQLQLQHVNFGLFGYKNDKFLLLVRFWYDHGKGNYLKALKVVSRIVRKHSRQVITNIKRNIYFTMRLFSGLATSEYGSSSIIDPVTQTKYKAYKELESVPFDFRVEIPISESSFCHRFQVNLSDINHFHTYITVGNSNYKISLDDIDYDSNLRSVYLCLHHNYQTNPPELIKRLPGVLDNKPDLVKPAKVDLNHYQDQQITTDSISAFEKGMVILGTMVALLIVILILRKSCKMLNGLNN